MGIKAVTVLMLLVGCQELHLTCEKYTASGFFVGPPANPFNL